MLKRLFLIFVLVLTSTTPADEPANYDKGDMPTIVVFTEFPDGLTDIPAIDIEYIATPSYGAFITDVFFEINGRLQSIYSHGREPFFASNGAPIRDVLGRARIPFFTGENRFEFVVRDSNGLEGRFAIEGVPRTERQESWLNPVNPEHREYVDGGTDRWLVTSRIRIFTTTEARMQGNILQQVEKAAYPFGGVVVGLSGSQFTIEVSPRSASELEALGELLVAAHPELFTSPSLVHGGNSISYVRGD